MKKLKKCSFKRGLSILITTSNRIDLIICRVSVTTWEKFTFFMSFYSARLTCSTRKLIIVLLRPRLPEVLLLKKSFCTCLELFMCLLVFLVLKLNLSGWHGFTKSHGFQVLTSTQRHLLMRPLLEPSLFSSPSPLRSHLHLPIPSPLAVPTLLSVSMCCINMYGCSSDINFILPPF